jgi:Ca-activated chloride channel homolog
MVGFLSSFPCSEPYNPLAMKYFYGEFNGDAFPTPDKLFAFDNMMEFILQYGEQALKAIEQMLKDPKNEQQSDLLEQLLKEGMLDKDGKGKVRLTPRAINKMQRKALMEVFSNLRQGTREGHEKVTPGQGGERIEGTKPYQYGDPVSELDLHQTLHNALSRHGLPSSPSPGTPGEGRGEGRHNKIKFDEKDFELHLHEGVTSCSTVVLLDMSGSMMRYGRLHTAKKVAIAIQALVRTRIPQDYIHIVGL